MYSETTQAITVNVTPVYLEEHSDVNENYYVWAYTVRIQNARTHTVRLISRRCPLTTPAGLMVGSYEMTDPAGETFEVNIPAFSLDSPHQKQPIN